MHEDHRQRVRKRFESQGLDGFDAHQVLEMMLFYSVPRKDTNEIAHRLVDRFGGFAQVMDAPLEELEKVEGVGHQSAVLLKFIHGSYRYYKLCKASQRTELNTIEDCAQYLMAKLENKRNEEVCILCLDARRMLINCVQIAEGDICCANVSTRKVVNAALAQNAVAVVLAHNHPGGFALPSEEDVQVTKKLARTLRDTGILLLDHIIVNDGDYVSLVRSKLYSPENIGGYPDSL